MWDHVTRTVARFRLLTPFIQEDFPWFPDPGRPGNAGDQGKRLPAARGVLLIPSHPAVSGLHDIQPLLRAENPPV